MAGVLRVSEALEAALRGTGPAIVPVPTGPSGVVEQILSEIRPDNSDWPVESDSIAVCIATSGSTGTPRGVLLTADALVSAATAFGSRFGTDSRWVVSLPVHRIGGLMVLVRSLVLGTPYEVDPSVGGGRPFDPVTFAATTKRAARRSAADGRQMMVSLVPTQITRLVEHGPAGIEALQAYDVVLSGAAATPQPLLNKLRDNGVNVVVSYGMSETCGGCVFNGQPLDGVDISLAADNDAEPGRISIGGNVLASGYRLRPDLDALTFLNGRVLTHDVGRLDQMGLLHVLGRLDDVVTVGGVNVALSAVEAIVRHHPVIDEVAMIDVTDPEWGSLPMAYITLRNHNIDRQALEAEIRDAIEQRIGRAALPRYFAYVDYLPMLDSGKVDRLALRLQATKDLERAQSAGGRHR
jgi:O-succinylbenzoic acid--CoA ligase